MLDPMLSAKSFELSVVELSPIIGDDAIGESEMVDDRLLEELADIGLCDPS